MKIGSTPNQSVETQTNDRAAKGAKSSAESVGVQSSVEKVNLSSLATQLRTGDSANVSGDFDAKKVESIKQAIRDGSFKVDAGAVADKMIAHTTEMFASKAAQ